MLVCFFQFANEAAGASFAPGIPCALSICEGYVQQSPGAIASRQCDAVSIRAFTVLLFGSLPTNWSMPE
jgi:hypothetical protein